MFSAIARVFRTPDLRRKIFFTLAIIAIYRLGAHVPTPFVNYPNVQSCLRETGSASEGSPVTSKKSASKKSTAKKSTSKKSASKKSASLQAKKRK